MTIVKAKINNGEFVNFTYNTTTGKWEAQLQVPDTTSYLQPDHKYGIVFEAWDEQNNHVTLDRTDSTWGSELAVRVREKVNTVIEVIQPAPPYTVVSHTLVVEFNVTDQGGSLINPDSIKVGFGDNEYGIGDAEITETQITDGYNIVFEPGVYLQDGRYTITITASDMDENTSIETLEILINNDPSHYILDRTQADVDLVKELHEKWMNGTITEEEKELYATDLKGARNKSDFERIITNMDYIALMFDSPYSLPELPEIPTESYVQALRDVIDNFRNTLPIQLDTPYTPLLPINTYQKMNDLEQILFDIRNGTLYRFDYFCDDGTYADEDYLI